MMTSRVSSLVLCAIVFAWCCPVEAGLVLEPDLPEVILDVVGDGNPGTTVEFTIGEFELEETKWKLKDAQGVVIGPSGEQSEFTIEEIEFDPDPVVTHHILVTNNTANDLSYDLTITLPTVYNVSPSTILGSIDTDVIDNGSDGATLTTVSSVYHALIDGSEVRTMQDNLVLNAPAGKTDNHAQDFGPEIHNGAVTQDIGIRLTFTLSKGDTATIISRFEVVPEPASLLLVFVGLGGGVAMLRRRH